ncbi:MAG TPA: GAF domain-containing protein [Candidatus Eisenbacteria bacterium]
MSKFDLRDISQRLTASRDAEAVVSEFLGYLKAVRPDWGATLTFYEVSRDALVNVYLRQNDRLARKDVVVPVDQLPPRLVRKFFHPSAFSNSGRRRSVLSEWFQSSSDFEPDPLEAPALEALIPAPGWQSCVCLPLTDHDDLLGLVVLTSEKQGAFRRKVLDEIVPLKSMATLALAQHLYRAARQHAKGTESTGTGAAKEVRERIQRLNTETAERVEENRAKAAKLEALSREIGLLDKGSSRYQQELGLVKRQLFALEEQATAASQHLEEAYAQIHDSQKRVGELQRTIGFLRDVFEMLSVEHDGDGFSRTLVAWFCEHFQVDRCSLMLLDEARDTLRINAHCGIDPGIASSVRVRVGQGIAGWVAHHRKPLFVRVANEQNEVRHTHQDAYNSDSFISVPLVYDNKLLGVLNLSNKRSGEPFDELDLDRGLLAGSVLATTVGARGMVRGMARA